MCQLNLYITESTDAEAIKKSLGKFAEKADVAVFGISGTAYCIGYCNCGSLPSKATQLFAINMKEEKYSTLAEYYAAAKDFLVEKEQKIQKAKKQADFKEKLKAYRTERARLTEAMMAMTASVGKYESEQTTLIYNMDISEKERSELLHKLYGEITEKLKAVEATDEYLALQKEFLQFSQDNILYEEAMFFTVKGNRDMINSLPEHFSSDMTEYRSIRKKIGSLLKLADTVTLYSFWQDGNTDRTPTEIRNINASDLSVDVIATLPYDVALVISRDGKRKNQR